MISTCLVGTQLIFGKGRIKRREGRGEGDRMEGRKEKGKEGRIDLEPHCRPRGSESAL